jgi:potassium efflux system protein
MTFIAARNLPGLLEITLLQRLSIEPGTRYAITAISRYSIIAVGLLIAFNRVGADWSQMQWIVAALGVGVGFGLQEIVANFVSGLIILFERPVRVGDTVTIGDVSGTVSRIQIRATSITDWDNREILVPNKMLITDTVTNWTLSDPVTRLLIPVGVAYGSDTMRAQELMLDQVKANPLVLTQPPPTVFFLGFGDSALNYEVRAFVAQPAHRLPVLHELHVGIERALREDGIQIPFPQRDLHLKFEEMAEAVQAAGAKELRRKLKQAS